MTQHVRQLTLFIIAFTSAVSIAEEIQLPSDALAQESVYPNFDDHSAVKDRFIKKTGKIEASLEAGTFLRDPFYSVYPFGLGLLYHLNEVHAFGVTAAYAMSSEKSQAADIQAQTSLKLTDAPQPSFYAFLTYEITPYYGKISVTKDTNINLDLSFLFGVGTIGLKSESSMALEMGLNQRFYLGPRFAIKPELKALFYEQRDVVFVTTTKSSVTNFMASIGLDFLF